jgi:hypothetical protein
MYDNLSLITQQVTAVVGSPYLLPRRPSSHIGIDLSVGAILGARRWSLRRQPDHVPAVLALLLGLIRGCLPGCPQRDSCDATQAATVHRHAGNSQIFSRSPALPPLKQCIRDRPEHPGPASLRPGSRLEVEIGMSPMAWSRARVLYRSVHHESLQRPAVYAVGDGVCYSRLAGIQRCAPQRHVAARRFLLSARGFQIGRRMLQVPTPATTRSRLHHRRRYQSTSLFGGRGTIWGSLSVRAHHWVCSATGSPLPVSRSLPRHRRPASSSLSRVLRSTNGFEIAQLRRDGRTRPHRCCHCSRYCGCNTKEASSETYGKVDGCGPGRCRPGAVPGVVLLAIIGDNPETGIHTHQMPDRPRIPDSGEILQNSRALNFKRPQYQAVRHRDEGVSGAGCVPGAGHRINTSGPRTPLKPGVASVFRIMDTSACAKTAKAEPTGISIPRRYRM